MQPSDIEKLKDALLPELQAMIKQEMIENHKGLSDQMIALKKQVEPISTVYTSFSGFGSVVAWAFKYIVIPVSIIIGILSTYHNIKK